MVTMNILEKQPDFPTEDLTEKNVDFLRELLQKPNLTHTLSPENYSGHLEQFLLRFELNKTEFSSNTKHQLYSNPYSVFRSAQLEGVSDADSHIGLLYGYTLNEIITELISPNELLAHDAPTIIAAHSLNEATRQRSLQDFIRDAKDSFLKQQKRTARLIGESAAKLYAVSAEDAVLGAAIRRQIELDSREYTQSIVQ